MQRTFKNALLGFALITPFVLCSPASAADDNTWGQDIPFTTSWDDAIQQVKETGKMLFIYNGWRGSGI